MPDRALVLTGGLLGTVFAKTAHGLVRGPSRFPLMGVIDRAHEGQDAGEVMDHIARGVPVYASVASALAHTPERVTHSVVGVATVGGRLPDALISGLVASARAGLTIVNGLHHLLSDDAVLCALAKAYGARLVDIRKPRPAATLRCWTGEVCSVPALRVAVLGMDCAIGKRTTCMMLREACRAVGLRAEMIYTGQTGWLQGLRHGFLFDATLNDFVSGELEGAILRCSEDTRPDVILMEGQSGLRNPAGPAGSELILSGDAHGVVMQHAPMRTHYEDLEAAGCRLPQIAEEVELVRLLGSEVWAVSLFTRGMAGGQARAAQQALEDELNIPVVCPLEEGVSRIVQLIQQRL